MPLQFEKTGSKYDRLSYLYDRLSRSPDGVTIKDLAGIHIGRVAMNAYASLHLI